MARSASAAAAAPRTAPRRAPRRRQPARGAPRRRGRTVRAAPAPAARAARARVGVERVLDRLLRGRVWIALVGLLLFGIVFSNVALLQRNREIARTAEYSTEVKRANESLRAELARLGSNERVRRAAAARGFALPAPGEIEYLRAGGSKDASKALAQLRGAGEIPAEQAASAAPAPTAQAPAALPATPEQAPAASPVQPAPPAAATPLASGGQ